MAELSQTELMAKVYKYKLGYDQIKSEANYGYICEKIEVNNGMFSHIMGMEYPEKGAVPAKDIFAVNQVKRLLIESARLSKYFAPSFIIFVILPYRFKIKIVNKFLKSFGDIAFRIMSPSILQPQHLTPVARQLGYFLDQMFYELGLEPTVYEPVVEILTNVINFDNAYRYRLQDLFNETTKDLLQNPRKEFKRLLILNRLREVTEYKYNPNNPLTDDYIKKNNVTLENGMYYLPHKSVSNKFKLFNTIITLIMLHPKVKRAYLLALENLDLDKCKPDKADWFWMCVREGYQYFGKTHKERLMNINHLKYVTPTKLNL